MDSQQILCFKTAALYQSITKAADALFMPQPSVSKQIKSLEEELKYELFDRRGRHIYLNDNGKILLKYINECSSLMADCRKELQDKNSAKGRSVTLLVMSCSIYLADILFKFRQLHPDIHIKIEQTPSYERDEDLCLFSQEDEIESPCCEKLLSENICLCVPMGDPLYGRKTVNIECLSDRNFIMLNPDHPLRKIVDSFFRMNNFSPNIIMEVGNPIILRKLILAGFGLSIAPTVTWQNMSSLNAKLVPFEGADLKRHIYISWNNRKYLSYPAQLLRDFLKDYFSNLACN